MAQLLEREAVVLTPPLTAEAPPRQDTARKYAFAWTLTLLCAGALGLRLYLLDSQSFWFDEGFTAYHAQLPMFDMLREIAVLDHHPPLHYILLNLWIALAGSGEYAIRLLSAALGTATVAATGVLAERMFGRATGLVAALMLAVSPFHIWYSQEARMYALLAFCFVMALLLIRLGCERWSDDPLHQKKSAVFWAGHGVFVLACLYTHYYGLFVIPIGFAMMLFSGIHEINVRRWALLNGFAFICFLPWVPVIIGQASDVAGTAGATAPPWQAIPALIGAFAVGEWALFDGAWFVVAVFLGVAAVGVLEAVVRGRNLGELAALAAWLVIPPIAAFAATLVLGIDLRASGRMYYIFALPAFLIVVARGISAVTLHQPVIALVGAAAVVAVATPSLFVQFTEARKEDFRGAAQLVQRRAEATDALILNAESIYPAFDYYYNGPAPWLRASLGTPDATAAWLRQATWGSDRAWVVLSHDDQADPSGQVLNWFDRNATLLEQRWLDGVRVALFSMEPRPNMAAPNVRLERRSNFAAGIQLIGYQLTTFDPKRHVLPVTLYWHNQRQHDTTYRIVVQLVDSRGTIWSQLDRPPIAGNYTTQRWLPGEYLTDRFEMSLPPGLPPLTYELRLFMYDQRDGRRVAVSAETGGQATSDVILTRVPLGQLEGLGRQEISASVERMINGRMGEALTVVGGSFPSSQVDPGARIDLAVLWQVNRPVAATQSLLLRIESPDGSFRRDLELFDQEDVYPPPRWTAGQLIRTHHRVTVPSELKGGEYQASLILKDTGRPDRPNAVPFGLVRVAEPLRVFDAPGLPARLDANFANLTSLLGYELPSQVQRNRDLQMQLQWRALAPMRDSYSVFVHILDAEGKTIAQSDGPPGNPPRATTTWVRDEIVTETRTIPMTGVPPGTYRVAVGMYNPISGARLQLAASGTGPGADRILLPQQLVVTD